jgi:hypothetical protein
MQTAKLGEDPMVILARAQLYEDHLSSAPFKALQRSFVLQMSIKVLKLTKDLLKRVGDCFESIRLPMFRRRSSLLLGIDHAASPATNDDSAA